MLKYFTGSAIFTVVALALAFVVGQMYGGLAMAVTYLFSALMLGLLEISVSLDNAVVNSTVLTEMEPVWRHRFITWGMAVAVFGMRLIFPLAIVSVVGHKNPIETIHIALFQPELYKEMLTSVHLQLMAFGSAFLLMIFSSHFIDHEKEEHWIPGVGHLLAKIGKHGTAKLFIPILVLLVFSRFVPVHSTDFLISAVWGVIAYLMVDGLGELFGAEDAAVGVARAGIAGFLYLEMVDASFSFDGVIAAFAITNNFIIIMLGLSIGAMFVRSLTLMLVDKGTLNELRYLEDGAFWGIGWLVIAMFLSTQGIELNDFVVAGGAAACIIAAAIHSIVANKQDEGEQVTQI